MGTNEEEASIWKGRDSITKLETYEAHTMVV